MSVPDFPQTDFGNGHASGLPQRVAVWIKHVEGCLVYGDRPVPELEQVSLPLSPSVSLAIKWV